MDESTTGSAGLVMIDTNERMKTAEPQGVHPVFICVLGSLMTQVLLMLHSMLDEEPNVAPWLGVAIDTIGYQTMVGNLVAAGWPQELVERWIPQSHYLELDNPFSEDFDFSKSAHREWLDIIHEERLQQLARKSDMPGAARVRALGNARVQETAPRLRTFFTEHQAKLTHVSPRNMTLLPGIWSWVVTTLNGGTGSGGALSVGAILKDVQQGGEITLNVVSPDVWGSDDISKAAGEAFFMETQFVHRRGGGVPMKGKYLLRAPFSRVVPIFASDGAKCINGQDAVMLEASTLTAFLTANSQRVINATRIDQTGAVPFDRNMNLQQASQEVRLVISVSPPGVEEFMATEVVRQEVKEAQERLERLKGSDGVSGFEAKELEACLEDCVRELKLNKADLIARMEPPSRPANTTRTMFDRVTGMFSTMKAKDIQQNISGLTKQVTDAFERFEAEWRGRTLALAQELPVEIFAHVTKKYGHRPDLAVYLLQKLAEKLEALAKELEQEGAKRLKQREQLNVKVGPAISAVLQASCLLWWMKNEVVRHAAQEACTTITGAVNCRIEQHRAQYLAQTVGSKQGVGTAQGATVPCVATALAALAIELFREQIAQLQVKKQSLERRLDALAKRFERQASKVFYRSLVNDGATRQQLEGEMEVLRREKGVQMSPEVQKYLSGEQSLEQTVANLQPLLPRFVDAKKTMPELLASRPDLCEAVAQHIGGCWPFAPIDKELESVHGFKARKRDRLWVLEVPGGENSAITGILRQRGVINASARVIDSGDNEIRYYFCRQGLPFWLLSPLRQWQREFDAYRQDPELPSLFSFADWPSVPRLESPATNMKDYLEGLLYVTKAVLPELVTGRAGGGFKIGYEEVQGQGLRTIETRKCSDLTDAVAFLAKKQDVQQSIKTRLDEALDDRPEEYREALLAAWTAARGEEKFHLQQELYRLGVDPRTMARKSVKKTEPQVAVARRAGQALRKVAKRAEARMVARGRTGPAARKSVVKTATAKAAGQARRRAG